MPGARGSRSSRGRGCSRSSPSSWWPRSWSRPRGCGAASAPPSTRSGSERAGAHLVKRSWSEPHWSAKRAAVMAHERVTLYGVPLVADRLVNYGKHDPEAARELFIRHALVHGEWHTPAPVPGHQPGSCSSEAEELEHRARRRDLVVDEHTLFDFYDAVVPADVVSGGALRRLVEEGAARRPGPADLRPGDAAAREQRRRSVPTTSRTPGASTPSSLPLHYRFEPGAADDGLSGRRTPGDAEPSRGHVVQWHVPGLREELVVALLGRCPSSCG